jgi:hypothetical protein
VSKSKKSTVQSGGELFDELERGVSAASPKIFRIEKEESKRTTT